MRPSLESTAPGTSAPGRLHRDLPAVARRVLIIGLDGATFDVLGPMMDSGRMENLRAFDSKVDVLAPGTQPLVACFFFTH